LQMLRSLIQRYADRGFTENDVLEDIVDIFSQDTSDYMADLSPIVTGLAVRLMLKPRLKEISLKASSLKEFSLKKISCSPALVETLSAVTEEVVKQLAARGQLKALPGLAASVGYVSVRDHHRANRLPQQLYQAATKVTQDPQLYQRLCAFHSDRAAASQPVTDPSVTEEMPQRLRINGPVEILIQHLGEK
jgi:hypothetical protein